MTDKEQITKLEEEKKADTISLEIAVELPLWKMVWATEPQRLIDVRMSYDDLKKVCDMIDGRTKVRPSNEREDIAVSEGYSAAIEEVYEHFVNDDSKTFFKWISKRRISSKMAIAAIEKNNGLDAVLEELKRSQEAKDD